MGTLFLEYRIASEQRNLYLGWIEDRRGAWDFELMEGTDQPGLFVELWRPLTAKEGAAWKRRRLDHSDPEWSPLHQWVVGGAAKLHVWHFMDVRMQQQNE